MLSAGCEVLLSVEPTLAFEQLSYSAVFNHLQQSRGVRVTHASVHERIWPNQSAFQLDVLKESVGHVSDEAVLAFNEPLKRALDDADLTSIDGRRFAAQEFIRIGQNANWDAVVLGDPNSSRVYHMCRLSLATFSDSALRAERAELLTLMTELRDASLRRYAELMELMCQLLGLRPKPFLGEPSAAIAEIARAANLTATGFVMDATRSRDELLMLRSGPDGALQEWRPVSVAMWSLLRGSFELSDDGLADGERCL